ncbi:unnamed protein product [Scytosiphon promiscuus]
MPLQEAAALAKRAVRHATYRDAFSGGFINVFRVDSSGWTRLGVDDAGFLDLVPTEKDDDGSVAAELRDGGDGGDSDVAEGEVR